MQRWSEACAESSDQAVKTLGTFGYFWWVPVELKDPMQLNLSSPKHPRPVCYNPASDRIWPYVIREVLATYNIQRSLCPMKFGSISPAIAEHTLRSGLVSPVEALRVVHREEHERNSIRIPPLTHPKKTSDWYVSTDNILSQHEHALVLPNLPTKLGTNWSKWRADLGSA